MTIEVTYKHVTDSWTKLCYHYETIEVMSKEVYGLTLKEFNKLRKDNK